MNLLKKATEPSLGNEFADLETLPLRGSGGVFFL